MDFDGLFGLLLAIVALIYVGAPLLVRFTMKQKAAPVFEPLHPDRSPPEAARHFEAVGKALSGDGFVEATRLALSGFMPNTTILLAAFENQATQDAAIAVAAYVDVRGVTRLRTAYLEFSNGFTDGRSVSTNNTAELSVYREPEWRVMTQFPQVQDCALLYRIHQALVQRASGRKKPLPRQDGWDALLREAMVREMTSQIEPGYLRLSPTGELYTPTWKGAFLMTWKLLPPVKGILLRARARRAEKTLAELQPALRRIENQPAPRATAAREGTTAGTAAAAPTGATGPAVTRR
ncbi:MAG TPA: hypothetical protein VFD82_04405 [Planctomycetota bacterium]|nr:hypothetical protein [Planctomycetota bacterium]